MGDGRYVDRCDGRASMSYVGAPGVTGPWTVDRALRARGVIFAVAKPWSAYGCDLIHVGIKRTTWPEMTL